MATQRKPARTQAPAKKGSGKAASKANASPASAQAGDVKGKASGGQPASGTSRLEWAVASIGASMVAGLLGFMVWTGLAQGDALPDLVVSEQGRLELSGGHMVRFTVRNGGDRPAADVPVRGELLEDGKSVEQREVTIDYVPGKGEQAGAIIFTRQPDGLELRLSAGGYAEP